MREVQIRVCTLRAGRLGASKLAKSKRPPIGWPSIHVIRNYGATPAGGCGAEPAVVAAAASFRIR
jgi:hypothetical protein